MKTITAKNSLQYAQSLNLDLASNRKADVEKALTAHDADWKTSILNFIEEDEDDKNEPLTHADHVAALANNVKFQKALAAMGGATGWVSPDELANDEDHFIIVGFDAVTGLPVFRTKSVINKKTKRRETIISTTAMGYYEGFEFMGDNTHLNVKALCDALSAGQLEAIESTDVKNIKGDLAFSDYQDFETEVARPVLLYRAAIRVSGTASSGEDNDYGKKVRFVSAS